MHIPIEATTPKPRLYLPFLDGLRGLAALFVVVHHCWLQSWPAFQYPESVPHGKVAYLTDWLFFGHFAVTLFIAISGFSLMLPVVRGDGRLREGIVGFFKRRAVRILPPYYAALLISYFIAGFFLHQHTHTTYDGSLPATPFGFFAHVFLIHDFWPIQNEADPPMWSIAVECQIYLFFPLLVFLTRRSNILSVLVFSFVVGFGTFWGPQKMGWYTSAYYYLFVFAFGMLAAQVCFGEQKPTSRRKIAAVTGFTILAAVGSVLVHLYTPSIRKTELSAAVLSLFLLYLCSLLPRKALSFSLLGSLCFLLFLALLVKDKRSLDFVTCDMPAGVASACLFVVCTLKPRFLLTRLLSNPWLEGLGAFSYSLYLVHAPFQQLLWQIFVAPLHLPRAVGFLLMFTLGTAVLIGIAYLFFLTFERPFLKRTKVGSMRAAVASEHGGDAKSRAMSA